jgi:hypothetical protein
VENGFDPALTYASMIATTIHPAKVALPKLSRKH